MITVADAVQEHVKQTPFVEEGLARGIFNLSALARELQPSIQRQLVKEVRLGAIIMALNRLAGKVSKREQKTAILAKLRDITVRSGLLEYNFQNSATLLGNYIRLLDRIVNKGQIFITATQGVYETSIFGSIDVQKDIEEIFAAEKLLIKYEQLSSITIMLPKKAAYIPGVHYRILKLLAWEEISIFESISTYTEFTVLLSEKDVDRAFSILKKATSFEDG